MTHRTVELQVLNQNQKPYQTFTPDILIHIILNTTLTCHVIAIEETKKNIGNLYFFFTLFYIMGWGTVIP